MKKWAPSGRAKLGMVILRPPKQQCNIVCSSYTHCFDRNTCPDISSPFCVGRGSTQPASHPPTTGMHRRCTHPLPACTNSCARRRPRTRAKQVGETWSALAGRARGGVGWTGRRCGEDGLGVQCRLGWEPCPCPLGPLGLYPAGGHCRPEGPGQGEGRDTAG